MTDRPTALPVLARIAVGLVSLHLLGLVPAAVFSQSLMELAVAPGRRGVLTGLMVALPLMDLGVAGVFVASARSAARLPPGIPGKLRMLLLGVTGTVHFALVAATWAVVLGAFRTLRMPTLSSFLSPADVLYIMSPQLADAVRGLLLACGLTLLPVVMLLVGHWFLVPKRTRHRLFVVVDALALGAMAYAVFRLPLAPDPDRPSTLVLTSVRHGITALFATRAFVRLVPFGLDAFQRLNVRTLIATRHLRAEKSGFLAFISMLSVLAVACSTCVLAVVLSIMGGFREDLERKILGSSAHVVIDRVEGTIEGWEPTLERVRTTPGITAATPYVQAEVMITSASNFSGALLRGIDPTAAARVNDIDRILREDRRKSRGSLALLVDPSGIDALPMRERCPGASRDVLIPDMPALDPKDGGDDDASDAAGILIGSELARSLRLCVGDVLEVVSPLGDLGPAGPMPKTRPFRVAGIFHSGMYEYDMKHVYVLLDVARSFLRLGDAISGIEARTANVSASASVASAVERRLGRRDLRVEDWRRRNRSLFGALELEKLLFSVTFGITVLIAGCCVFATITLMVFEKRREVGILKALGASDASVVAVFLYEGLLIGLLGASAGLGLGGLLCFALEHFGLRVNAEVIYLDKLPVEANLVEFLAVGVASVLVSVLSTLGPAFHASRLRPVDAVRDE